MTQQFTQGHALLVGVGADLPNTVDDATGLAALLADTERCAYPTGHVHLFTEQQATRSQILNALDQLAASSDASATIIFYFSGHGYEVNTTIGKSYFLLPYGYALNTLATTAINGAELMAKLNAIPAQKMLVLLDCCHAGGLEDAKAPGASFAKAPIPAEAVELLAKGSGRVIIASSQADELSYAGKPYSQFTQALLEALAGAGASKADGYVRAADLAMYARETVPSQTKGKQHPVLHFEQADNFVVAYYAAGDKQPKGLPAAAQRQAISDEAMQPTTRSNVSAGDRGVAIGGNVTNSPIITGNNNRIDQSSRGVDQRGQKVQGNQTNFAGNVNTGGGQVINGDVNTGGGDFVGRDIKNITTGNVSGTGVAIGRGAQVHVNQGLAGNQLAQLFVPLLAIAQSAPADKRDEAIKTAAALQEEAAKGKQEDDSVLAELLENLVGLVPSAVSTVVSAFASPILAGVVGPATKYVLRKLGMSGQST